MCVHNAHAERIRGCRKVHLKEKAAQRDATAFLDRTENRDKGGWWPVEESLQGIKKVSGKQSPREKLAPQQDKFLEH